MELSQDNDSYEFVSKEEFNSCKSGYEDPFEEREHQRNGVESVESSDMETNGVFDMDKKMDDTDDDSYVMVDHQESYNQTTDSENDALTEIKPHKNGTEFADSEDMDEKMDETNVESYEEDPSEESISDIFLQFERCQLEITADQRAVDIMLEFPANIKRKEDMEIKDVVKDHVLPFLPVKSLLKFRSVSKEWDKWIINPFLAHKQSLYFRSISGFFCQSAGVPTFMTLNSSAYGVPCPSLNFLPELVVIKSSCNGLILCQGDQEEDVYYVCNPANEEWEALPKPDYYLGEEPNIVLAFEPSELNFTPCYQVICPLSLCDGVVTHFEIYSSDTKSWKLLDANCAELAGSQLKDNGFYSNGIAYWETWSGELLAFDVKNELCGVNILPPERTHKGGLCFMEGELCYIEAHKLDGNEVVIDVYGGMNIGFKESINVEFSHLKEDDNGDCRVLSGLNADFLVILVGGFVYTFHVRNLTVDVIGRALMDTNARYLPYVNSFVSLACK